MIVSLKGNSKCTTINNFNKKGSKKDQYDFIKYSEKNLKTNKKDSGRNVGPQRKSTDKELRIVLGRKS